MSNIWLYYPNVVFLKLKPSKMFNSPTVDPNLICYPNLELMLSSVDHSFLELVNLII